MNKLSSNKYISLEQINNPTGDLGGYINFDTSISIGLESSFYSVIQRYNSGNSTQIFIPILAGGANCKIYIRTMTQNTIIGLYEFLGAKI